MSRSIGRYGAESCFAFATEYARKMQYLYDAWLTAPGHFNIQAVNDAYVEGQPFVDLILAKASRDQQVNNMVTHIRSIRPRTPQD